MHRAIHCNRLRARITTLILVVVCLFATSPVGASNGSELAPPPTKETLAEQRVKSAFIFYFAKFTSWPKQSFQDHLTPIRVGVVGNTSMAEVLTTTLKDKIVAGRKVEVVVVSTSSQLERLHALYFGPDLEPKLEAELLTSLRKQPVLTIGHDGGFAKRGGIVNFFIANKKMRFEINVDVLKDSALSISSQLLRLAKIVRDKD
jgi:hypothetical protein